ncbi:UNVERIFIED_CONTAM: CASP-like protein 2B1 [Sesamum angustifolium]|uniref:CASP-like protein n=1 Tax=Sesamum angustifolium TaxID=2727405 RepID=A0AAW2KWL7_9LAMI
MLDGQFEDYCVADEQASEYDLLGAMNWACSNGANCTAIQENQPCYLPNTPKDHASYAFNSYYQNMKHQGGGCYFTATAVLTGADPSKKPQEILSIHVCKIARSFKGINNSKLDLVVKMSYLGVGVSPGNVPVYHGSNLKAVDRRVRVAELVLRSVISGLAILSALLIGTDTQVKEIFSIQKKAKFTDMKALVFLVIANGLAAAYSLVQLLRCILSMIRGSVLFNKPLAWAIFSGDQVMSYLMLAAVAAAAQSAALAKLGQPELQWMKICDMYAKFCNQVGEGIASALFVSISFAVVSAISAFSLFRLYGENKRKNSGGW